jgi:hypothetical protein
MVRTRHGCAREPLELNSRFHNTPATRVLNDAPLLQHFLVAAGKFRLRCPQAFRPSSGVVSTTRLTATRRSSGTESGARHVRKAPQGPARRFCAQPVVSSSNSSRTTGQIHLWVPQVHRHRTLSGTSGIPPAAPSASRSLLVARASPAAVRSLE